MVVNGQPFPNSFLLESSKQFCVQGNETPIFPAGTFSRGLEEKNSIGKRYGLLSFTEHVSTEGSHILGELWDHSYKHSQLSAFTCVVRNSENLF